MVKKGLVTNVVFTIDKCLTGKPNERKSPNQRLFSYREGDRAGIITSKDVNDYLKQWGTLSTKYFVHGQ